MRIFILFLLRSAGRAVKENDLPDRLRPLSGEFRNRGSEGVARGGDSTLTGKPPFT